MVCKRCGETVADGERFCPVCGTDQMEGQGSAPKKKKAKLNFSINPKLIAIVGIAVVAVIALILIFGGSGGGGANINYIEAFYIPDDEATLVFFNDKQLKGKITGIVESSRSSADGSVAVFLTSESELYVVTKKGFEKVAEEVTSIQRFAVNGSKVAYRNEEEELFVLKIGEKKPEFTYDNEEELVNFVFSPNGNNFAYVIQDDEGDYESYVKVGKSAEKKLENGAYVNSISNDGKIAYGSKYDDGEYDGFYAYNVKKEEGTKLTSEYVSDWKFNETASDILFSDGSKYFLSVKGGEKSSVGKFTSLYPMLADGSLSSTNNVWPVKSFTGIFLRYRKDNGDIGVGSIKKGEFESLFKAGEYGEVSQITLCRDGKTFYISKENKLYTASKKTKYTLERIASGMADYASFDVSPDGKKVYFINEDEELIRVYKGKETSISDDVDEFTVSAKGTIFFLVDVDNNGGTLYYSKDGKKRERIAEEIANVVATEKFVAYITNVDDEDGTGDVYVSTNDKKFTKMVSEADF